MLVSERKENDDEGQDEVSLEGTTYVEATAEKLQTSASESDGESGSEYNRSLSDPERKPLPISQLKVFQESYKNMRRSEMWLLSSGVYVEDILFKHGQKLSVESLVHSWIVDLNDTETANLFNNAEQSEIRRTIRKVPEVSQDYAQSLMRFIRTADELRHIVETTSFRLEGEAYDREKYFDAEWVENLNGWYDTNVWAPIVDRAFGKLYDVELVR
ncbi:hypothetical protein BC938DRAFT_480004 [Jimgerdemannia flammicorona]|uniref:Uncharacterized protein n=1 Tax=Jimgerdemannia flammicorona TaxID=994334 RepID=A0A433QJL0_9FUNG|nr:hypothetical protein BC938DRAFT_480004 [Jimgerdemannia flammicorona]